MDLHIACTFSRNKGSHHFLFLFFYFALLFVAIYFLPVRIISLIVSERLCDCVFLVRYNCTRMICIAHLQDFVKLCLNKHFELLLV